MQEKFQYNCKFRVVLEKNQVNKVVLKKTKAGLRVFINARSCW